MRCVRTVTCAKIATGRAGTAPRSTAATTRFTAANNSASSARSRPGRALAASDFAWSASGCPSAPVRAASRRVARTTVARARAAKADHPAATGDASTDGEPRPWYRPAAVAQLMTYGFSEAQSAAAIAVGMFRPVLKSAMVYERHERGRPAAASCSCDHAR
jgi:hypothetical protein